jgi:hypothetical protein
MGRDRRDQSQNSDQSEDPDQSEDGREGADPGKGLVHLGSFEFVVPGA